MKAAPDKSHFFLTNVKFLRHIIEGNKITPTKFRMDAILKLQPPSKKSNPRCPWSTNILLKNYVYKLQLYLGPFHNIIRQQNNVEWTLEHQKRSHERTTLLTDQSSNTIPDPDQPFYAMFDT